MATIDGSSVKKLIVACDAGMGISVMLASTLKKQLAKNGVTVEHSPVANIPSDADVVVTQAGLAERARGRRARRARRPVPAVPGRPGRRQARQGDPGRHDGRGLTDVRRAGPEPLTELLAESSIRLDATRGRVATRRSGRPGGADRSGRRRPSLRRRDARARELRLHLRRRGCRDSARHPRRQGRGQGRCHRRPPLPDGVDWDGNEVSVAVGIAAKGNGHIALLSPAGDRPARPRQGGRSARRDDAPSRSTSCSASDDEDDE